MDKFETGDCRQSCIKVILKIVVVFCILYYMFAVHMRLLTFNKYVCALPLGRMK